jgi:ferritin-like metal-binding protein YciE
MAEVSARDAKLIQYLNEAYGKERELETALQAHITMTTRAPYKKRLQQHLRETKDHARRVNRRIKELGGKAEAIPAVPDRAPDAVGEAAAAVTTAASRALAAAKGPLHAIRGTSNAEKMLKNAKTEYFNEFEEIATYKAIETLAETVGDRETQRLARAIRREEERMASFLERQIPTLTKAVAQTEIPASERRTRGGRKRQSTSRSRSRSTSSRSRSRSTKARSRRSSSQSRKARSGGGRSRKRS